MNINSDNLNAVIKAVLITLVVTGIVLWNMSETEDLNRRTMSDPELHRSFVQDVASEIRAKCGYNPECLVSAAKNPYRYMPHTGVTDEDRIRVKYEVMYAVFDQRLDGDPLDRKTVDQLPSSLRDELNYDLYRKSHPE